MGALQEFTNVQTSYEYWLPPQILSEDIAEFHSWSQAGFPTTPPPETHPYFEEMYRLDILPCLTFRSSEV